MIFVPSINTSGFNNESGPRVICRARPVPFLMTSAGERPPLDGGRMATGSLDKSGENRVRFGRLLSEALKRQGMRQDDLARALGTTQSSVSGWINGKYEPAAATVFAVERELGLDPGHLSRPLGYLPVEPVGAPLSVEGAIAESSLLEDDEKAALVGLYHALVKRRAARVVAEPQPRAPKPTTPRQARLSPGGTVSARPRTVASSR